MDLNPQNYSNFGLNYNLRYLDDLFPKIAWYPIEEQSKLADMITKRYASNIDFCEMQNLSTISNKLNATSIGNIAYMTLNCCKKYRNDFRRQYELIISYIKEKYDPKTSQINGWKHGHIDETQRVRNFCLLL